MTPEELELVEMDGRAITASPDRFSHVFYDTLFEVDPDTRRMRGTSCTRWCRRQCGGRKRSRLTTARKMLSSRWPADGQIDTTNTSARWLNASMTAVLRSSDAWTNDRASRGVLPNST